MPLPKPHKGEAEQDFVSRCIGASIDDNTFDNTEAGRSQAAAACFSQWRDAKKQWSDGTLGPQRAYSTLQIKSISEQDARVIEGIASTPTPDRVDDVVEPMGGKFSVPMPLLWQHDAKKPIGHVSWAEATPEGIKFRAVIAKSAEAGTLKDRLDEAWQSIKLGLVRAVSIGFRALEAEPVNPKDFFGGTRFKKWEWLELSAVTIPANVDASILNIRNFDTRSATGHGDFNIAFNGDRIVSITLASEQTESLSATRHSSKSVKAQESKPMAMKKTIADQISAFEATLAAKALQRDDLMDVAAEKGETLDEAGKESYDTLSIEIKNINDHLARLRERDAENKKQAVEVTPVVQTKSNGGSGIITVRQPTIEKGTTFFRYCQVMMMAKGNKFEAANYAQQNDRWMHETPQLVEILRTGVNAGTSTDSTWAGPLVQYTNMASEFIDLIRANTVFDKLTGFRRVPFNIDVPRMTAGTSVNWVGEGQPKPLTKGAFDRVQLRFSKVAGIVAFTQELVRFSNPSAEAVIRADLTAAVAQFIDEQFIDPSKNEVANVSPASITYGAPTSAASGETAAAFIADAKTVMISLAIDNVSAAGGYWIMTPGQAVALGSLRHAQSGLPEFPDITVNGGTILGFPVVTSNNTPSGNVIFIVPREVMVADDGGVSVDVSTEASLQMDDDPSSGEQQSVSLWQSNMIGVRVERFINWRRRRDEAVYVITGADYGGIGTGT